MRILLLVYNEYNILNIIYHGFINNIKQYYCKLKCSYLSLLLWYISNRIYLYEFKIIIINPFRSKDV